MNKLSDKDIDRILNTYEQRAEIENFSHKAALVEIVENVYNCNIPSYVDTFEEEEQIDIQAVRTGLVEITAKKQAAMNRGE